MNKNQTNMFSAISKWVEFERQYQGTRTYGNKITEQYLAAKEVLSHYIKA